MRRRRGSLPTYVEIYIVPQTGPVFFPALLTLYVQQQYVTFLLARSRALSCRNSTQNQAWRMKQDRNHCCLSCFQGGLSIKFLLSAPNRESNRAPTPTNIEINCCPSHFFPHVHSGRALHHTHDDSIRSPGIVTQSQADACVCRLEVCVQKFLEVMMLCTGAPHSPPAHDKRHDFQGVGCSYKAENMTLGYIYTHACVPSAICVGGFKNT